MVNKLIIHNKSEEEFEIWLEPSAESFFIPKQANAEIELLTNLPEETHIHFEYIKGGLVLYEEHNIKYKITIS